MPRSPPPQTASVPKGANRAYCFTYNNPTITAPDLIELLKPYATYIALQAELCPKTQTPHYQGYIELIKPMRYTALLKVHPGLWYAKRFGTRVQARDYCMKEDTRTGGPWEFGVWNGKASNAGERTDLRKLIERIREGATTSDIQDEFPNESVRYHRAIESIRYTKAKDKPKEVFRKVKVFVLYGEPGLGKTKYAYDYDPQLYAVPIGKDLWFDGYMGERTILLDDFSGQMKLLDLLRVLDGYPNQVPIKGGFVWQHNVRVLITTNEHPDNWYDYTSRQSSLAALKRRIKSVLHFTAPDVFNVIEW